MTVISKLNYPADNVKFKIKRYNSRSEPWQKFSPIWDKSQIRNWNFQGLGHQSVDFSVQDLRIKNLSSFSGDKNLEKQILQNKGDDDEEQEVPDVYDQKTTNQVQFQLANGDIRMPSDRGAQGLYRTTNQCLRLQTAPISSSLRCSLIQQSEKRQLPKYGGFIPRFPLIKSPSKPATRQKYTTIQPRKFYQVRPLDDKFDYTWKTSSSEAYKRVDNMPPAEFLKKTSLSSMVTTVPPCNPFRLDPEEGKGLWSIKRGSWKKYDQLRETVVLDFSEE